MTVVVERPRFERRAATPSRTLGIGVAAPRLSWRSSSPDPSWTQAAYEIEVTRGAGAEVFAVASPDSVFVPWPAAPLRPREEAEVRVRVRSGDDAPWSEWSAPALVEAGVLDAAEWTAHAIGPGPQPDDRDGRPALLRQEFTAPAGLARAVLRATAHGVFEAEINGRRVGDDALAPGWTAYKHRLRVVSYDVTDLVEPGANAIGAWLGDGWYRGRIGFEGGVRELYGDRTAFFAELELTAADGSRTVVVTDGSWLTHPSPIVRSGLYDGEKFDATEHLPGWSRAGFDAVGWTAAEVLPLDTALLVAPDGPPVRCTAERTPVSITPLVGGRLLLDFGQNLAGRLRIRSASSTAGETIALRHAEVLQGGELYTRPLRQAASVDAYVADGGPIDWEPRFTIHGFRFAEVSGWTGDPRDLEVVARVYHSDMTRTGTFESSNPLVNRLHENVLWSMRSNFVDIPTDCPQRDERLGWTGDIQVFTPTAAGLFDVSGFLASWLKDVAAEQLPDGTVPWYVPVVPGGPYWTPIRPGAVWGDAAVLTPWDLYRHYGDRQVLADQYASARAWVDLVEREAGPSRLWESGQQLGDWLDPTAPPEDPTVATTDKYLVATAYFEHSARILGRIASELGRDEDAARYATLADEVRVAFRAKHMMPGGTLVNHAQTAYALAIAFDLFDADELAAAGESLRDLVASNGYRIGTGFAGTPLIANALSAAGQTAAAYRLLLERECPSWLYTVLSGGTTIWERWDSQLPDGTVNPGEMTSFNHYALGSVAAWMHDTIAGIAPLEPAFRRFRVAPQPGGGLTWARRTLETPYGEVAAAWTLTDGVFDLVVDVPTGTTAEVVLPSGATTTASPGRYRFAEPASITEPVPVP
ncbi:glycoside hydrolase family 78 protein [Leifsonia sp. ZF2019]|uniref:glycoside hydrolase family 78 protein n=1 Tax=Leifsonia sp. ZF2019 TaxID=2781978 RepID=UPI001CBEC57B|nr:glycoside hydrolase family 78 protein [Leifsonia sp. ZF2019]UAJ79747.1 glycoside hydrolase family 78 protein [Leifsonia sp. ZF2019]